MIYVCFKKASKIFSKLFLISFILYSFITLSTCATIPPHFEDCIAEGITYKKFFSHNPPIRYHLITIDLNNPKIDIVSADNMTDTPYPGETTHSFAKRTNATVAINGNLFCYPNGKFSNKRSLLGLCIVNGKQFSPPRKEFSALIFTKKPNESTYTAKIMQNQTDVLPENTLFAIGGFFTVINDNKLISHKTPIDSRTAVGTANNGKTLYILCVEGEDLTKTPGLTFDESAEILLKNGAEIAMQLDGGGSTSLIINGQNALSYWKPRLVAHNFGFITK